MRFYRGFRGYFVVHSLIISTLCTPMAAIGQDVDPFLKKRQEAYLDLYRHFHQHPELSGREGHTSQKLAQQLDSLGYRVLDSVGGYGLVGVLRDGPGPVVLIRTDMDALPLKEKTGLAYACTQPVLDKEGKQSPAMHACGHDMHMAIWAATAAFFAQHRDSWSGTLLMLAQPAEETGTGALAMLEEELFSRVPKPDYALALHVHGGYPAGSVGLCPGHSFANMDFADITVYGIGGHGAYPHLANDPVYLSAQIIERLQSVVSREINPVDPAVITVGSIHGGTKHNIIPDEVRMQATMRSYKPAVKDQIRKAIVRVCEQEAKAAGLPDSLLPTVRFPQGYTPATQNDPMIHGLLKKIFTDLFGKDRVMAVPPVMGGEDFAYYSERHPDIASYIFWLGAAHPEQLKKAMAKGESLPGPHSPAFAPEAEKTWTTGSKAMIGAARALLKNP